MDWITIEGVAPYDGRYQFDLAERPFTTREWGWIKRLSGYLPLTLEEGFQGGDPELFAVFAAIALRRAGQVEPRDVPGVFERLADGPFETTIRLETDTEQLEDDAGPPPSNSNGNEPSSGLASAVSSASPAATPPATGITDSATSGSDWTTLVS